MKRIFTLAVCLGLALTVAAQAKDKDKGEKKARKQEAKFEKQVRKFEKKQAKFEGRRGRTKSADAISSASRPAILIVASVAIVMTSARALPLS